ncbi:long-chain-fatty-acid--CoA ligase [Carboxydothermus islandicus]|uniref:Long-chain-fatty-acid--CoA ligase n=1 Tax=Carboxydothermus islandicus TaxID=661089 RepID=A0A1L8D0D5_9THEO|nr:long-chain fatty acid--CoA ligase [Carboxydothermus islandicus]GAV24603.1 long-chain-fatty-acid--CoA ligase [Carboxydothermus islandicus]
MVENAYPWVKHYPPHVPLSLTYPETPLYELLKQTAQKVNKTALIFFNKKLSYSELTEYIENLAINLSLLGLEPGDRVGIMLPNSPQYVIVYFALMAAGMIAVPLNPLLSARELTYIIEDAGVKAIFALNLFAEKLKNLDNVKIVYTAIADFLAFPLNFLLKLKEKAPSVKIDNEKIFALMPLLKNTGSKNFRPKQRDLKKEPAVIIYTSGTTGKPKGVMLSEYALIVNAYHVKVWGDLVPEDVMLTVLPIFHGFGMSVCMNAPLLTGSSVVLLPRFSVDEFLKSVAKHRPTLFAGVPTMFVAMLNHKDLTKYDLSSFRGCFVGAAAMPPEVKEQFEKMTGAQVLEGYGLTEAVTAKCCNPYRGINKTGSIGIPFPDTVMEIVDAFTGEPLPPGEIGEIRLKSPDLMLGYYKQEAATREVIKDGWLYTGDIGRMDEDGYFYIVDRKKDLIITGGFNVYPREVEDVLYSHPDVKEACVVGIPDNYYGEVVKAYVVLKEGAKTSPEELKAFCRENLTHYKVPKIIEIKDDLPKSAIGKILRRALKEMESEAKQ